MKSKYLLVLAACLTLGGNVYAEGGYQLAQKHMCTSCHSLDRKIIGPPWMSISSMYQNRADAETYLIGKIRSGGSGTWGTAKMPPSNNVGDADIKILAKYILGLVKE
jgi:cytochrome c551/c552